MKNVMQVNVDAMIAFCFHQILWQQQLVEAQRKVIELQARIDAMTPKNAPWSEILWHVASGMYSLDAATSNDLATVIRFRDWLNEFAKAHIKPYVNPTVFGECLTQMTRGLSDQIAKLEMQKLMRGEPVQIGDGKVIQRPLGLKPN